MNAEDFISEKLEARLAHEEPFNGYFDYDETAQLMEQYADARVKELHLDLADLGGIALLGMLCGAVLGLILGFSIFLI